MRKLAIVCASAAAAIFLSFYLLPRNVILPLAGLCAPAGAILLWRGKRTRHGGVHAAFLVLLGAALGLASYALHWNATIGRAVDWDETEQSMYVCLLEYPEVFERYTRLQVQRTEAPKLDLMLYAYDGELPELHPGDRLKVTARFRRADLRRGEKNNNYISKNIYLTGTLHELEKTGQRRMTLRTVASSCSKRISDQVERVFSDRVAVFMKALMLGEKTDFYQDLPLYARMRGAGFMHIVAVSGMHVAFLVGMIQLLFGARPMSSVAGILLVGFFVVMTGASPSAVRAGIMISIQLLAPIFRRENDGPTSLMTALALILLVNPFSCASISLQMSFSAMAGMVLLAGPLTQSMLTAFGLSERSLLRAPVATVAASLAVLAFSAPLSALHFGTLALYSPLVNLLGLWAVSACFCLGWFSCLAGLILLPLGRTLAAPAALLARYLIFTAGLICRLPHHLISMAGVERKLWLLLCYVLALLGWLARASHRFRVLMPVSLAVVTLTICLRASGLRYLGADAVVAALDVGQGECVCVLSGDTTLMLDCGGSNLENAGETATNYMEAAGRSHLDLLVLSHLHDDHCNGVEMLLELVPVEEIILSPDADMEEGRLAAIEAAAERHGTTVTRLDEDAERVFGSLRLKLFAPPQDGSENERCIISLASIGDYDMLMTGDSLKQAELDLVEKYSLPDTELLIVGHHGSRTSTDNLFLEAIRVEDAVISVGSNNSYGHPNREVLARLQLHGCNIWRTDRNGTVEIRVKHA